MKQEQLFHAEVEIALSFNKFQNPENVTFVGVPKKQYDPLFLTLCASDIYMGLQLKLTNGKWHCQHKFTQKL